VSSAQIATSAAAVSPQPPPSAWPCTRATTGRPQRAMRKNAVAIAVVSASAAAGSSAACCFIQARSAPALKLLPRPPSTTTRADASRPAASNTRASSATTWPLNALRTSGRFNQTRRTAPSRSTARVVRSS
jgi:hypothetical protein